MAKFLFFITLFNAFFGFSQTVSTLAGTTYGYNDGEGIYAQFRSPRGICTDVLGNIYVADFADNRIRKIETTGLNMVTTIAGSGVEGYADGTGTNAVFGGPAGICIDNTGNLYVTDFWNFKIRKITPTGIVTTLAGSTQGFADGNGGLAKFGYLGNICIDSLGNLFVADAGNHKIRKITPAGNVTTVAGTTAGYLDGAASVAKFDYPEGICIDTSNNLYVCEAFGAKIRKITPAGTVSTIAGSSAGFVNGQGTVAKFFYPTGISVDALGNFFVTDNGNNQIRKITSTGLVSTFTGSTVSGYLDGDISTVLFCSPQGIMITADNTIHVTQGCGNPTIRKITPLLNAENFVNKKMFLYPNPNNGTFYLDFEENILSIVIYNMNGKEVYKKNNIVNKTIETNLAKGMYLVKITNNNNRTNSIKMIVN